MSSPRHHKHANHRFATSVATPRFSNAMNSLARLTPAISRAVIARPSLYAAPARSYATDAPRKPIGGFRGGLMGFLIGITLAGGVGYYYLIDEYHAASSLLLNSVEELQASTNRVRDYARKIESVDKDLKKVRESTATIDQLEELRSETKKLYDNIHIEHLELKTHVWGIEQDVHKLVPNKQ